MAKVTEQIVETVARAIHDRTESWENSEHDRVSWEKTTFEKRQKAKALAQAAISSRGISHARVSRAQASVFAYLSEHTGITASEAVHIGANGRTLSAMTERGWLTERHYPNGPRVWELTPHGDEIARDLAPQSTTPSSREG